jgi:multidrug efflux system membrane fusion protein
MGAKVTFLAPGDTALAAAAPSFPTVVEAAVQREGSDTFVWLLRPDRTVEKRSVRLGAISGGQVEITSGLAGGETVALHTSRPLTDGAKVRLVD